MEQEQLKGKHEPLKGEKTVKAMLRIATFIGKGDTKQDDEVNAFLETIDNQHRFLNGRNAYSMGDKAVVQIWYLQQIEAETTVEAFGKKKASKK